MTYRSKLEEFGGPLRLNRFWAHSLLEWMHFVTRKLTTAKINLSAVNCAKLKLSILDAVHALIVVVKIPPEPIMTWNQKGINIIPSSTWTMEKLVSCGLVITGIVNKFQIAAVFCGNLTGDL